MSSLSPPVLPGVPSLEAAYMYCRRVALGHYENFPVGSLVLPKTVRPHVYAIYAFARAADDFADEGTTPAAQRLANLSDWRCQLEACTVGRPKHPVFLALGHTIQTYNLPQKPFHDLLDAFELDVRRSRHATFEDLLDYSRCSANPIGQLMLLLFGYRDLVWHQMSDAICTALQLTNFWQDVAVDLRHNRVYLPLEEMTKHGYSEAELQARRHTPAFVNLMESLATRTEALFERGRPLCGLVPGRFGFELRLVWLGGRHILQELRRLDFNVFEQRPTLDWRAKASLVIGAFRRTSFLATAPPTTLQIPI
ncbi:MAG: squalene synthase HpnC [Acidobacteriota bacterium]